MSNVFQQIAADTAAANSGEKPEILTDTYGNRGVPDAAKFGVGTSTREGAQEAQDARRNATPGEYGTKR